MVLPCPVSWVPEVRPSSEKTASEKRSPGTAFRPGWEKLFTGSKSSEPPAGKKRPYCPWTIRLHQGDPLSCGPPLVLLMSVSCARWAGLSRYVGLPRLTGFLCFCFWRESNRRLRIGQSVVSVCKAQLNFSLQEAHLPYFL